MRINGLGCSLVDNLYSPVDFNSKGYIKYLEANNGGTGITTGGLVFGEALEEVTGMKYRDILKNITGGDIVPNQNIGGPAIVALINMSQVLIGMNTEISFYGAMGNDENGIFLSDRLDSFKLNLHDYLVKQGQITPFTDVLSDPSFHNNKGERSFINYIGAAGSISSVDLSDSFYDADILIYGGTGLTPGLHDDLSIMLGKGKEAGCFNFVNTVYDFRNQNLNPDKPWPLVNKNEDYRLIDLFVADNEEAIKISGQKSKEEAVNYFAEMGVHSVIITHGADDILCYSDGSFFKEKGTFRMPVSEAVDAQRHRIDPDCVVDTTGCGDNFTGGVYASAVEQLEKSTLYGGVGNDLSDISLKLAAACGVVTGGFASLYLGGVYYETRNGEKLEKLKALLREYEIQTGAAYE